MKTYNFDENTGDFDKTVRLDKINEAVRKTERGGKKTAKPHGKKTRYSYFVILMAAACVVAFVILFAYGYKALSGGVLNTGKTEGSGDTPGGGTSGEKGEFYALALSPAEGGAIRVYDMYSEIRRDLNITSGSKMGSAGSAFGAKDIKMGDILKISIELETEDVMSISYPRDVFERAEVTGVVADGEAGTLTYNGASLFYDKEAICVAGGQILKMTAIDPCDTLYMKGVGSKIWFVRIDKLHGAVILQNTEKVKGGKIRIDGAEPIDIGEAREISIAPGARKILITGDNIEDYTVESLFTSGQKMELDLEKIPEKTGVLVIKANVPSCKVSLGGEILSETGEPMVLPMGEHTLTITKDGYLDREVWVNITEDYSEISVGMEKTEKTGVLNVSISPFGANVYADGVLMGQAPLSLTLPYGEHRIKAEKEGYLPISIVVNINGGSQDLNGVLKPGEDEG